VAETIERLVVGPLATNCYILKSGVELAVIDPGGDAEMILQKVGELGGTVKYVIDTHGHIDHIAAYRGGVADSRTGCGAASVSGPKSLQPDGDEVEFAGSGPHVERR